MPTEEINREQMIQLVKEHYLRQDKLVVNIQIKMKWTAPCNQSFDCLEVELMRELQYPEDEKFLIENAPDLNERMFAGWKNRAMKLFWDDEGKIVQTLTKYMR